jgi:hypothetical protein
MPTARNGFKTEYLGEFKVEVEMVLGSETGDYVGLIHEKKNRGKNLTLRPLKKYFIITNNFPKRPVNNLCLKLMISLW